MITRDDIANYIDYVEKPDRQILSQTKQGLKALISGKQKDGYYVVVEEAQTKNNRLAFKTMYKVKGDIKESSLFKATADAENGERLAFSGYEPDAQRIPSLNDHIIPQNSQKVKELSPADLRKAIINAKDDKERLAIIENQKAGIRQRLKEEMTSEAKTANNKEVTPFLDQKLIERANENSQFNRGNIIESNLRKTLNSIDDLEISEAKKEMAKKKIIVETQRELKAAADFIPANVSGATGFNVKKAGKQLDRITKAQEKKAEIIERAGEKNSRFNSFNADIADSEFIKIGNYVTLSGKPKIAVSFRTIPDGSVRLALKKKGFFYDNGISAWSIEPEKFDKSWISGRLSQLFNKDESTLNLKAMTKNDDPFALLPNATATRLRKMRRDASEKDILDHLINNKSWYDKYVVKYNKDRKTLEKALNIAPIEKFGINYAEFYHDGSGAVKKLLAERQGQVAGAFYSKDLGDVDIIWGEAKQNAKGGWDGYGLAKIEKSTLKFQPKF